MDFTRLPYRPQTRELMDKFLGYDRRPTAPEGSFAEMRNCSSDLYPMLSPRKPRATMMSFFSGLCTGIIMKDKLCRCDGELFRHGDDAYEMGLSDEPKQLVSMGAYVLIFPDKKYFNTADPEDRGDIEAEYTTTDATNIFICRPDGKEYTAEYVSGTEPDSPKDKAVWVNTAEYPNTLHQWNEAACCWVKLTTSTIKLFSMGIGEKFKAGDGITISGIKAAERIMDMGTGEPVTDKQREQLEALEGSHVILECNKDEIVINGIMDAQCAISSVITIKRSLPIMDFIVEHGNRLWGCRYGLDAAGEFVNMVYASKLGDFRNWTVYRGIDTDSYYANVGTDGPFTGAISWGYGDRVLFFKADGIHTVSGGGPATFRVDWTSCEGVQKGSHRSLRELGGVVYYKSPLGVCAYAGGMPTDIGQPLVGSYHDAVGGTWRDKYYLSMLDRLGAAHLFAFDNREKLWHREDDLRALDFADAGEECYLLAENGNTRTLGGSEGRSEGPVQWMAQTGILGTEHPDRKYLTRINVRMKLERGSRLRIFIRYDSAGSWVRVAAATSARLRAYDFPIRIRRCDHYELRFEGEGPGEVQSIVKTYQTGSDRK